MSPFQDMSKTDGKPRSTVPARLKWLMVAVYTVVFVLAAILVGGFIWKRTLNDPYRTLEVFSADKYFENQRALMGNRFQATLRLEGDLGWSAGVGKLMVFSLEGDSRYLPVLISDENLNYSFSKGQTYLAQITVKEGGLLYATDLRKK